jgi:hypothetical protein
MFWWLFNHIFKKDWIWLHVISELCEEWFKLLIKWYGQLIISQIPILTSVCEVFVSTCSQRQRSEENMQRHYYDRTFSYTSNDDQFYIYLLIFIFEWRKWNKISQKNFFFLSVWFANIMKSYHLKCLAHFHVSYQNIKYRQHD